jgi:hypothetical protein
VPCGGPPRPGPALYRRLPDSARTLIVSNSSTGFVKYLTIFPKETIVKYLTGFAGEAIAVEWSGLWRGTFAGIPICGSGDHDHRCGASKIIVLRPLQ